MRRTTLIGLLITTSTFAQWSNDPAAPMVVSNAANEQRHMRAIADADSGYYVFWSDLRSDPQRADLYGQRFDSEGHALWTANGELLMAHPSMSVNELEPLLMPDGSVIVAYMTRNGTTGGDTIRAMRFDADGNALWGQASTLFTAPDYRSMKMVLSDSCAYIVAYCNNCGGGGYGCRMQRVRMDGSIQFATTGEPMGSSYHGPYTVHPDGAGGLLFSIRCANGAGTCLKAQRFDSLGAPVWPGYIELADGDGLNYGFVTATDGDAAQTTVWEVNGDLRMSRIDTLSNPLWSPAILVATGLPAYSQIDPNVVATDDALFVAWRDNRPPASNYDLYVQKYDRATGVEQWATDGVSAIHINNSLPATGMVLSDSGGVVVTIDGSQFGYAAMRVHADGTLAWNAPVAFCTPAFNPSSASNKRVHLSDGKGGVVIFWHRSNGGDIHGARVYRNGLLYDNVGIAEHDRPAAIQAYPNPAQERITFNVPGNAPVIGLELIGVTGARVDVHAPGRSIDVQGLAAGPYTARIRTEQAVYFARFIKQ